MLAQHWRHNASMGLVRARGAAKSRFADAPSSAVDAANRESLQRAAIHGLWFSGRPREVV